MTQEIKVISSVNMPVSGGRVVFGDVVYSPGGICGPRIQPDYQLVILREGKLDLKLDQLHIKVEPGHAILLSPKHLEHFIFSAEYESHHAWCAIHPDIVPPDLVKLFSENPGPAPLSARGFMLLDAGLAPQNGSELVAFIEGAYYLQLALALCCDFVRGVQLGHQTRSSGMEIIERFERYVSREYSHPLTLKNLAMSAGVSPQHLMRICRLRNLPTPFEYLFKKRLEVACDWLTHTGLSIGEIADRCGFSNAFHFSRKFKQIYGVNPLQWRRQTWNRQ